MKGSTAPWTLLIVAFLGLSGCANPTDQAATGASPDDPVSATAAPHTPPGARPLLVTPMRGMADVHAIRWEQAEPAADGRRVRVFFTSGPEPCNILDHVDVAYSRDAVSITLFEGSEPTPDGRACIEIAVAKAVDVALDQPRAGRRILDGSDTAPTR
jgi:hypothetical protein